MIGIYEIKNKINGNVYIGETFNIERRFEEHKNELLSNIHHNINLQRDFNKYGFSNFNFSVIQEYTDKDKSVITQSRLIILEDLWMKRYKDNGIKLYNIENTLDKILHSEKQLQIVTEIATDVLISQYKYLKAIFADDKFVFVKRNTIEHYLLENYIIKYNKVRKTFLKNLVSILDKNVDYTITNINYVSNGRNRNPMIYEYENCAIPKIDKYMLDLKIKRRKIKN